LRSAAAALGKLLFAKDLQKSSLNYLSAYPNPSVTLTLAMTLKASIVAKACLPSILAVLMYLELVSRGAVDYLQNIQVARPVGLPSALATSPSRIKGDSTARRTL
tara:strand:+ start:2115 stop:2429 length:315 start_codon:yes stop_codon:yes gene_type:complete